MKTNNKNPVTSLLLHTVIRQLFTGLIYFSFSMVVLAQSTDSSRRHLEDLDEYCVTCHNLDDYAGSLDLSLLLSEGIPQHAETWEKVIRKLRAGMMPHPASHVHSRHSTLP